MDQLKLDCRVNLKASYSKVDKVVPKRLEDRWITRSKTEGKKDSQGIISGLWMVPRWATNYMNNHRPQVDEG